MRLLRLTRRSVKDYLDKHKTIRINAVYLASASLGRNKLRRTEINISLEPVRQSE